MAGRLAPGLKVAGGHLKNLTLDVKKSNSSNETPNVMTVGVENYGLISFELLLFLTSNVKFFKCQLSLFGGL
jgi:aspartyl aminopeptidase